MSYLDCMFRAHIVPRRLLVLPGLLAPLLMLQAGCNKSPYPLAQARGRVTLDGQAINKAKVMFAPVAQGESKLVGKPAFGVLQSDGSFVLGTYQPEDGAVVGEHWVTVIRMQGRRSAPGLRSDRESHSESKRDWDRVMYPERVKVTAHGENNFTISLTSELVEKHGQLED